MIFRLRANVSGKIKLTVAKDAPAKSCPAVLKGSYLVYDDFVQDSISTGYFAIKAGYGWIPEGRKFNSQSRSLLKEVCSMLDTTDTSMCVFATGTLPGSTQDSFMALSGYSAYLVSRLCQWMRDKFYGADWAGVWEYQKRGALHLHLVVRLPTVEMKSQFCQAWKTRWIRLLDLVSRKSGVDLYARKDGTTWNEKRWKTRTDCQTVEKSVSRYLAKYLSKGSGANSGNNLFPPTSWWFAKRALVSAAKRLRVNYVYTDIPPLQAWSAFEKLGSALSEFCSKSYPLENRWDSQWKGIVCLAKPEAVGWLIRQVVDTDWIRQLVSATCTDKYDSPVWPVREALIPVALTIP